MKTEKRSFRVLRWSGIALANVAWIAFLISFFLPTAFQIGVPPGAPLGVQSGWQTFTDTLDLPITPRTWGREPLAVLAASSFIPNGMMLLAPAAVLMLRRYGAFFGLAHFLTGTSAIWICPQVYEGLSVGFYVWVGSIQLTAIASMLVAGSYFMEDNTEHLQLMDELKDAPDPV